MFAGERSARVRLVTRRVLGLWVFVPIGAYVLAMLAIAGFVTHPSTLGWIGFGVAAAVALLVGTVALILFPRMRTNADRVHPHPGPVYRLLVVLDADVDPAELGEAVKLRLIGRHAEVRLVAPVIAAPLHYLTADEDREVQAARERIDAAIRSLAAVGVRVEGTVGTDDPLQAVGDALTEFRADEILLVASLTSRRGWLDEGFERRARDLYDIPVSTVFGGPSPAATHVVATTH